MEAEINGKVGKHQKETASLSTISELFDIPLWTLRKYASERRFPGIIKRGRSIYVDVAKFRAWLYSGEIQSGGIKSK